MGGVVPGLHFVLRMEILGVVLVSLLLGSAAWTPPAVPPSVAALQHFASGKDVQWPQAEFSKARAWQDESWQREDNTQCDTLFDEDLYLSCRDDRIAQC